MKRFFYFEGRIDRLEYFLSTVVFNALMAILNALQTVLDPERWGVAYLSIAITLCWFLFAQSAKRCHDLGHNGWWQCIPFYVLWMLFAEGNESTNEYGKPVRD